MITAQDLTIPKLSTAPVIDGVEDEVWNTVDEVTLELFDEEDPATVDEAWFKMAWNDTALFMIMFRADDDFADQWETGLADWQSDRDEIFLDVNVDTLADGRGASDAQQGASYGHYQFTSIWVQDQDTWVGRPNQWYHNAPFDFAYAFDGENSYITEYAWPFTSLTINTTLLPHADAEFQGEEGVVIGLEVVVADVDMADDPQDETARKFLRWKGSEGWETMDASGTVMLGARVSSLSDNNAVKHNVYSYPVPATDYISIANLPGATSVEVIDIAGQVVLRKDEVSSGTRIDVSTLPAGSYLIKLNSGYSLKFLKQ